MDPGQPPTLTDADAPPGSEDLRRLRSERDRAVEAAQSASRDSTPLTRLLTILSEPAPHERLLDRVLSTLSELFSADIALLVAPNARGRLVFLAAVGLPADLLGQPPASGDPPYVLATMRDQQPVRIDRVSADPSAGVELRELGVESAVWVPVRGAHDPLGVLVLARCRELPFAHADVDLLSAMAYRIGLTLAQAQRSAQLEQIVATGRGIARHLDEGTVRTEAVRMFKDVVGADAATLLEVGADEIARCVAQCGLPEQFSIGWSVPAGKLLAAACLTSGEPFSTADVRALPHQYPFPESTAARAVLAVPLAPHETTRAVLYAVRFSVAEFSADAVQVAKLYSSQVSAALQNARLYRAAREELEERVRVEAALRSSETRFRALIRSVSDVIAVLDADATIRYLSPAAETHWGSMASKLIGLKAIDRVHPDDQPGLRALLDLALRRPRATVTGGARLRDGHGVWRDFELIVTNLLDDPAVGGIVTTCRDITERKEFESELTKLAFRDPLTDLANRALFHERVGHALERAHREARSIAVLFSDLDNFKLVNDSLGHAWGDQVLRVVAERLRSCVRAEDTVARLGGDEFTILMDRDVSRERVETVAQRVLAALRAPIALDGRDVCVGGSVGIAISTPGRDTADDVLRKADLAMYQAKNGGKGRFEVFDERLTSSAIERLELETDLRQALLQGELRVHYQPIVSVPDRRLRAVEALVRWQHPQRGLVAPAEFIPVAEQTGMIVDLGRSVLREACRQVRAWQLAHPAQVGLAVSVNLSAREFEHPGLLANIRAALDETGLGPSHLQFEITESDLMTNAEATIAKLQALRQLGVRFAIDDFGAGYSSLSYLKQFPVDTLKIDRAFVHGVGRDPHDTAIVRSIVALAAAFGLEVTAEGIEDEHQLRSLAEYGCGQGQGYLFGRPLPAEECAELFSGAPRRRPTAAAEPARLAA